MLNTTPTTSLAPRALLMTGLFRMAGCELFIHGTGGGGSGGGAATHEGYDRITEGWLGAWLGKPLAPSVVATATLRLRISHDGPDAAELRRQQWAAHRAMHDPSLVGDAAGAAKKGEFVRQIRGRKRSGEDARTLYKQMHAFLERVRADHAAELARLEQAAMGAAARVGDADIAADRTWAFPLYERDQLADLGRALRNRLAGTAE
jgi:hypothetical protein